VRARPPVAAGRPAADVTEMPAREGRGVVAKPAFPFLYSVFMPAAPIPSRFYTRRGSSYGRSRQPSCRTAWRRRAAQEISLLDLRQPHAHPAVRPCTGRQRRIEMLDAIMLAIGVAFFALCIGYVVACEKL
jgi:hypothetical protein